jgi:hypothetical protein
MVVKVKKSENEPSLQDRVFLEKLIVTQLVKRFLAFMEYKVPLLFCQKSTIAAYLKLAE